MKKKVLMSLLSLVITGTGLVFAQAPTLDKLSSGEGAYVPGAFVIAANKQISGEVVIPAIISGSTVTQVAGFDRIPRITSVSIPNTVTHISADAFRGSTGLTGMIIPASVTNIGSNAFRGCTGLSGITIGAGVKVIETNAFNGCTNLTSVTFQGARIDTIAPGVFPGDLTAKYRAGGEGTYTRQRGSNT